MSAADAAGSPSPESKVLFAAGIATVALGSAWRSWREKRALEGGE